MMSPGKSLSEPTADTRWYLRLMADALVIVTFCGLAIALANSFAIAG